MIDDSTLLAWTASAVAGDRGAAQHLLGALQDGVYRLAMRMLGHPQDAEDATQEVLIIVLTQLGSFRGESSVKTWAWRIAANHLMRVRKGRRETVSFESQKELLETGLRHESDQRHDLDEEILAHEVRLRCTEGMMLSLDRESRLAYLLSDVFELSGEEAALVLEVDAATYRKRVSRARARLHEFLRVQCGLFDPSNPCRCERQVTPAVERGFIKPKELLFANLPAEGSRRRLERYSDAVTELVRAAEIVRHPDYTTPASLVQRMRELLDSGNLKLLRS